MSRLIRVFAGRKGHFVGFVVRRPILLCLTCVNNTYFCYFKAFYFLKLSEKARVFMYPCTCTSPFIMSYCRRVVNIKSEMRRVVILTLYFTTVYVSHCSYNLLVGPRGDVRVVSLIVNGYADIYKDNTRKHLRTHTLSNRRSIITTGLKLFRTSMLSTELAL